MPRPTNADPGIYRMRLRGPNDPAPHTVYVEGPSLEAIVSALGGRYHNGGPVVWGGIVFDSSHITPDIAIVPFPTI